MPDFSDAFQTMVDPLLSFSIQVWAKTPSILAALILLLLGSFVGRWLRILANRLFGLTKLDEYSRKIGLNELLFKMGMGESPSNVLGFLIYWVIFLAFLLSAANVVQLTVVSEFLQQVVLFMPKLIAAILILGGGLFLGHFIGEIVLNAAQANNINGAEGLSKTSFMILVIFSGIMALQRLGFDTTVLSRSIEIVLASLGAGIAIAFGLAFGLAGKESAEEWIKSLLSSRKKDQ